MAKILIVDDAAFMRLSIKTMVEKHGFEVVGEAANGIEAVAKYKECKPDITTMDITMPEMTGIEAVKKIKLLDKAAKIIMVSAMGQEKMVKDAVINGATSFIVKPFTEDKLVEVLKALTK